MRVRSKARSVTDSSLEAPSAQLATPVGSAAAASTAKTTASAAASSSRKSNRVSKTAKQVMGDSNEQDHDGEATMDIDDGEESGDVQAELGTKGSKRASKEMRPVANLNAIISKEDFAVLRLPLLRALCKVKGVSPYGLRGEVLARLAAFKLTYADRDAAHARLLEPPSTRHAGRKKMVRDPAEDSVVHPWMKFPVAEKPGEVIDTFENEPPGYKLFLAGDMFMSRNARALCRSAGFPVYEHHNKHGLSKVFAYSVPIAIYDAVVAKREFIERKEQQVNERRERRKRKAASAGEGDGDSEDDEDDDVHGSKHPEGDGTESEGNISQQ